jgi:hypothetical protein
VQSPLNAEEVIRQLRMLRSPDNRANVRGGRKIPLTWVASTAGRLELLPSRYRATRLSQRGPAS